MKKTLRWLGTATLISAFAPPALSAEIKNVILLIGDGMGPQQVGLLETYARLAPHSIYQGADTALQTLAKNGRTALSLTHPSDAIVVDSACSATQLAIGKDAPSEALGVDYQGNPQETVLEKAKRLGKATGLVSDTRLTHATPAAFAAHQPHRSLENEIAEQMLEIGPDVMLSGGLRHWIPMHINDKGAAYQALDKRTGGTIKLKSKRKDNKDLLARAESNGYQLAFNRGQLDQSSGDKLLGLFAASGMADGIRHSRADKTDLSGQPSLKEMTAKAIATLQQDNDGFFLMIEGGQIDWSGHNNDTGTMLHEMLKFDETLAYVYDWVKDRDDTVVIVTADHETGSFGFSYSAANIPSPANLPGKIFEDRPYQPNFNFGSPKVLDAIYNQKQSFTDQMAEFYTLTNAEQTAANLARLVNRNNDFTITEAQAVNILATHDNPYYLEDHKYLSAKTLPRVKDFPAFYVYGKEIHLDLIGRELAEQQNVVWGTGTHTNTPVSVMAYGPEQAIKPIAGLMHHSDLGAVIMDMIKE